MLGGIENRLDAFKINHRKLAKRRLFQIVTVHGKGSNPIGAIVFEIKVCGFGGSTGSKNDNRRHGIFSGIFLVT